MFKVHFMSKGRRKKKREKKKQVVFQGSPCDASEIEAVGGEATRKQSASEER